MSGRWIKFFVKSLALAEVPRSLSGANFRANKVLVNLLKHCLIGIETFDDASLDRRVAKLAHGFEAMQTGDQFITARFHLNANRLKKAPLRNRLCKGVDLLRLQGS